MTMNAGNRLCGLIFLHFAKTFFDFGNNQFKTRFRATELCSIISLLKNNVL
jgi:hypothetical protein